MQKLFQNRLLKIKNKQTINMKTVISNNIAHYLKMLFDSLKV